MSKHRKHIRRDEAHKKTVHIDLGDQIIPHFNANPKFDTVNFYGKEWELIPEPNPRDLEANWVEETTIR